MVEAAPGWPVCSPPVGLPPPGEVHCYRLLIDRISVAGRAVLSALLSPVERERAAAYRREEDRLRSVAAYGALRQLAGAALEEDPARLVIGRQPGGRPVLRDFPLHFNLSHSGRVVLVALSSGAPVGIDVEEARPLDDFRQLAAHAFHPAEVAALQSYAEDRAQLGFFRLWTRKEALVKALGLGLALPLDQFQVSAGSPRVLSPVGGVVAACWTLGDLDPAPGYVAAFAVPAAARLVKCATFVS